MAAILVLLECFGGAAEMMWWCHCCCTAAAAGRQAGPSRVFSRAIVAILPTTKKVPRQMQCRHAGLPIVGL